MTDDPQAEAKGHIKIPAEGELVPAIEQRRPHVAKWIIVVGRLEHKILIAGANRVGGSDGALESHRVDELRQRIRDLEVRRFQSPHRIRNILYQLHLQAVVNRPADREQEGHVGIVLVDSAKSAGMGKHSHASSTHAIPWRSQSVSEKRAGNGRNSGRIRSVVADQTVHCSRPRRIHAGWEKGRATTISRVSRPRNRG